MKGRASVTPELPLRARRCGQATEDDGCESRQWLRPKTLEDFETERGRAVVHPEIVKHLRTELHAFAERPIAEVWDGLGSTTRNAALLFELFACERLDIELRAEPAARGSGNGPFADGLAALRRGRELTVTDGAAQDGVKVSRGQQRARARLRRLPRCRDRGHSESESTYESGPERPASNH